MTEKVATPWRNCIQIYKSMRKRKKWIHAESSIVEEDTYKVHPCRETIYKIKKSITHSDSWDNSMQRCKWTLTNNGSQGFFSTSQRNGRKHADPDGQNTQISCHSPMNQGVPCHSVWTLEYQSGKTQQHHRSSRHLPRRPLIGSKLSVHPVDQIQDTATPCSFHLGNVDCRVGPHYYEMYTRKRASVKQFYCIGLYWIRKTRHLLPSLWIPTHCQWHYESGMTNFLSWWWRRINEFWVFHRSSLDCARASHRYAWAYELVSILTPIYRWIFGYFLRAKNVNDQLEWNGSVVPECIGPQSPNVNNLHCYGYSSDHQSRHASRVEFSKSPRVTSHCILK